MATLCSIHGKSLSHLENVSISQKDKTKQKPLSVTLSNSKIHISKSPQKGGFNEKHSTLTLLCRRKIWVSEARENGKTQSNLPTDSSLNGQIFIEPSNMLS